MYVYVFIYFLLYPHIYLMWAIIIGLHLLGIIWIIEWSRKENIDIAEGIKGIITGAQSTSAS